MTWQRPSRCDSASCVEVKITPTTVGIRTRHVPETTVVATHDEWHAFIAGAKAGEDDLPGTLTTQQEIRHRALQIAAGLDDDVYDSADDLSAYIATGRHPEDPKLCKVCERPVTGQPHHTIPGTGGHVCHDGCARRRGMSEMVWLVPEPTQEPAGTVPQTGLSATLPAEPGPPAPTDTVTIHDARMDDDGDVWTQHHPGGPWKCSGLRQPTREGLEYTYGPTRPVRIADDRRQTIAAVDQYQETQR